MNLTQAWPHFGGHTQPLVRQRPTMADNCDCRPTNLEEKPLAYRRALALVVLLNLTMGVVEMATGIIAGSQALKADALDFVGDGVISFLGLLAIGWRPIWRARSALIQGVFLGLLGLGVIGTTIYRMFVQGEPEAEAMGVLALIAFAVNVSAAIVLMQYRSGDANIRAVWLFSRNDALGNLAVVIAAIAVYVSDSQ